MHPFKSDPRIDGATTEMRLTGGPRLQFTQFVHAVQTKLAYAQVLTLTGRLDPEAVPALEQQCEQIIASDTRMLVVDVGTLDYLSSAGLRALLGAGRKLQANAGKMVLVAASGPLRQIVELAGFDKIFPLCATVEEVAKGMIAGFQIEHTNQWGVDVLNVSGRVDAERAPELEQAGRRILVKDYLKVIINLSAVPYLSSAGLCALLNLAKLAKSRHCRLLLCGPTPPVRQILSLTGFDKLFPIREELSDALAD